MIETVVGPSNRGSWQKELSSSMRWGYDSSRRVAVRLVAGCKSRTTTFKTAAEQSPES
jgi:hypothetical protein